MCRTWFRAVLSGLGAEESGGPEVVSSGPERSGSWVWRAGSGFERSLSAHSRCPLALAATSPLPFAFFDAFAINITTTV